MSAAGFRPDILFACLSRSRCRYGLWHSQGFRFLREMLEVQLRTKLAGHEEILTNVIKFSHSLLENTKAG